MYQEQLKIARETGGSIHALDSEVQTLESAKIGDTIEVSTGIFRVDETGFVRIA